MTRQVSQPTYLESVSRAEDRADKVNLRLGNEFCTRRNVALETLNTSGHKFLLVVVNVLEDIDGLFSSTRLHEVSNMLLRLGSGQLTPSSTGTEK